MPVPNDAQSMSPAEAARALVRSARKAALATLDATTGVPYASLVTVATEPNGAPLLLLSRLALHTRNLQADHRASLMFDGSGPDGDPLAGGRVTLAGSADRIASATARRRFLARHPGAEGYVDFADFGFFSLAVDRAHYIGGFGRIVDLPGHELITDMSGADALVEAEPGILAHMNADHADTLSLYATKLLQAEPGSWKLVGLDPLGCDLVGAGASLRLPFGSRVLDAEAARAEFVRLARLARS